MPRLRRWGKISKRRSRVFQQSRKQLARAISLCDHRVRVMAQLFSPRANIRSRVIIFGAVAFVCGVGWATSEIYWSPYTTYVDVAFEQPVPFSHKHHVSEDGIDCR